MHRPRWIGLSIIVFLILAWFLLVWDHKTGFQLDGITISSSPHIIGGDFSLRSQQGIVNLHDFRGKVILLYFGYTGCPDICPTSLGSIATAFNLLQTNELASVQALFVSVDPKRDSLDILDSYTNYFHPKIMGITGTDQELRQVVDQYGADYRLSSRGEDSSYLVDHTAAIYLIDIHGQFYRAIPYGTGAEEIVSNLRELL